jgi:hypothetical protein
MIIWFTASINWLKEPVLFWKATVATLIVLAALGIGLSFGLGSERSFRIAGLIFQLFGICTVAWGIHETRTLFGRPSIFALLRQWLRSIPRLPRTITIDIVGPLSINDGAVNPQVYVWRNAGPGDPLETRIAALENNLTEVNIRLAQQKSDNDNRFIIHKEELDVEVMHRTTETRELRTKLEVTETGGLYLSGFGVFWIFLGVILSAMSIEIAHLYCVLF